MSALQAPLQLMRIVKQVNVAICGTLRRFAFLRAIIMELRLETVIVMLHLRCFESDGLQEAEVIRKCRVK